MVLTKPIRCVWFLLIVLPSIAVSELKVTGVDGALKQNIELFVALSTEPCDAEAWRIQRRFRNVERETRRALQPLGFYNPALTTSLDMSGDCWSATLDVDPGKPVRLRDVDVGVTGDGRDDQAFSQLLAGARLNAGDRLQHDHYTTLKQNLQTLSADRGYVEAEFTKSSLDIYPDALAADVALHVDTGPRYRVGEIRQEQDFLDPKIVSAYLDLASGDYYNSQDLSRAYRDLSDSAYFGRIDVVPDFDGAEDQRIPIRVFLEPGNRTEYTIGAGVSTDTGPRLKAGFRNNRINTRGHRLYSDMSISEVLQGISAEYRIPLADPRREWFSVTGALSAEYNDTFETESQSVGVRWSKAMTDNLLRTYAIDFTNESYDVGTSVATTRGLVPSLILDHKKADREVFPGRGRRVVVEFRGTGKAIGSTYDFLQTVVSTRVIRSLGDNHRFIARVKFGYTETSDFTRLPPKSRFFAGGDESVRGFDYEALGPKDADGNVIGGKNLLVGSIEYERRIKGNFYGAVFVDAGNAFNGSTLDAEVGTGLGIKWRSPIGPVRFYVGFPVSDNDESPRIHLRLGADL